MIDRKMTLEPHMSKDFAYDFASGDFRILTLILTLTLTLSLILVVTRILTLTPTLTLTLILTYSGPAPDRSKNVPRASCFKTYQTNRNQSAKSHTRPLRYPRSETTTRGAAISR